MPTLADSGGLIVECFRAFCGGADQLLQKPRQPRSMSMEETATREAGLSRSMAFVSGQ
jgi:hypothetical protein